MIVPVTLTGEDMRGCSEVYSGKNRGGWEVERLRGRLIRELREGGSQEGKRQKKNGRNREHSRGTQDL